MIGVIVALWIAVQTPVTDRPVLIASHRSCWQAASENALDGIETCADAGIDIVEIDIRTTRDGALVLMHDETVDRTTDGHGAVADLSASDLASLRLRRGGGGADAPVTDRHIPTLSQALATAKGRVIVNLDVKAATLDRVIDTVAAIGMGHQVLLNVPWDVDPQIIARAQASGVVLQPVYVERTATQPVERALGPWRARRPASVQLLFDTPSVLDRVRKTLPETRLFVNTMAFDIASGTPMRLSSIYLDTTAITRPDAIWGDLIRRGVSIIQTDEAWQLKAWRDGHPAKPR